MKKVLFGVLLMTITTLTVCAGDVERLPGGDLSITKTYPSFNKAFEKLVKDFNIKLIFSDAEVDQSSNDIYLLLKIPADIKFSEVKVTMVVNSQVWFCTAAD